MSSLNEDESTCSLLRVALGRFDVAGPRSTDWEGWVVHARVGRVVPLLYHLVDAVPTDLTDDQREEIKQLQGATLSRCVQLEHHAVALSRLFDDHGIRNAVLKGGATAHLDYPDPSWREVSDIDLLVEPREFDAAIALLAPAGWVQSDALPAGHEQFTHSLTFVRDAMELDLHQRIGRRALGLRVPTPELLDRSTSFEVANCRVHSLDDVDRLIHSALHMVAARGIDRRISSVADVLLAAEARGDVAREVLERAEHWRVRPLVEGGVRDAYTAAQLEVPLAWAKAMRRPIRRRDRLVEVAYVSDVPRPVIRELAYLRLMKSWHSRWRYVSGYFRTDPEYVQQHARSGVLEQARYVRSKLRS